MATSSLLWIVAALIAGAFVASRLSRVPRSSRLQTTHALGLAGLLAASLGSGERFVERRHAELRSMVEGIAPTFAYELERDGHARVGPGTPADEPVEVRIPGRRVLIVDDNATNREVVRRHLALWQVESVECASGAEALQRVGDASRESSGVSGFDAVILDLMMPAMDGLEVARRLREHVGGRTLPIILLTSMRVSDAEVEGLDIAARITKPLRRSELYDAFMTALGRDVIAQARPSAIPSAGPFDARILVVEDDPVNQRVVSAMLARMGCTSAIATDGPTALSLFDKETFDLARMDVMLPGMDGFETTRRIRAIEAERGDPGCACPRLPIVALTAHGSARDRDACLVAGMDDWVSKPFTRDGLTAKLERWLTEGTLRAKTHEGARA